MFLKDKSLNFWVSRLRDWQIGIQKYLSKKELLFYRKSVNWYVHRLWKERKAVTKGLRIQGTEWTRKCRYFIRNIFGEVERVKSWLEYSEENRRRESGCRDTSFTEFCGEKKNETGNRRKQWGDREDFHQWFSGKYSLGLFI